MEAGQDVKLGEWIDRGFKLYKANFPLLILSSFLFVLVSVFSLGILAGPMMIGFCMITLRLVDGEELSPSPSDIFQGFTKFLDGFLFAFLLTLAVSVLYIVLSVIPCLGWLAAIFGSVVISALVMFAPFKIAESDTPFWPACRESIEVVKTAFWPLLAVCLVASLLGQIGSILCGIGIFLTLPLTYCILGVASRDMYSALGTEVEPLADDTNAPTSADTQIALKPEDQEDSSGG